MEDLRFMIYDLRKYLKTQNSSLITHTQKGFTIVELLLYMGIFSILLTVLLQLFGGILSTHTESQATSAIDQDGNFIMARLAYDIHNSSSIGGSNCSWATGSVSPCTLVLDGGTYSISGGVLSFGTERVNGVGTTLTSLSFTTLGNSAAGSKKSVQITFTLQSTALRQGNRNQTQDYQTTVQTR